jgi:hypothetical protein
MDKIRISSYQARENSITMTREPYPDSVGMCGVNCALASCFRTGTCRGCRSENPAQKRKSKWKCPIRTCVLSKQLAHCGECAEFPCTIRRRLDKTYREKYGIDLPANILALVEVGPTVWCAHQQSEFTCPACGGTVDPYKRTCYECGKPGDSR